MKYIKPILFYIIICCATSIATAQSISVDDTKTAQDLVNLLTNNNTCTTTSSSRATGDTFTAGKNSYGYFNNQGGSFPFTEGIILNTWSSTNAIGPYISGDLGGGSDSWLGDTDLDQALNIRSKNATVLEFDFVPLTNFISFNYIFASNEYQGIFPCNFSDGFAFLIKENIPGSSYQNLAVLPGTTTPVSSKNVHPAISPVSNPNQPINGCPPANENYFQGYNTGTSPINYAGQTKIMNAQTTVTAGKMYHIKLIIADADNRYFDSAIFLKAGSFTSKIDLGPDRTAANPVCFGESLVIDTKLPSNLGYVYSWYKDGSLIPGEMSPSYTVTGPGTYKVVANLGGCPSTDEITIDYTPEIILNDTTLYQCDDNGDGITTYNLTTADTRVKNNNTGLSSVEYYEFLADAKTKTNPISNPTAYRNNALNQIVFARVTNSFGCAGYAQVTLGISNNNIASPSPVTTCDGDNVQDGLYHFDLNAQVTPQLSSLPAGSSIEYYLTSNDAIIQKNPLPNIFNNTSQTQQIFARIMTGSDCYSITPVTLSVHTFDPPNFQDETTGLCDGASIILTVDSTFSSYLWNTGATTNTITVTAPGNYSVTVTDANGCEKTKKFNVVISGIATITGADINDFDGNNNSVLIQYTGLGNNYEFSLDGSYYQDNPLFTNVAPGDYMTLVRDKNGCGLSNPFLIHVLDYPRFFTPNSDGFNDLWKIKNLDLLPKSTIHIFDRYGKLIKEMSATTSGWNGTFNGYSLPADDYWFSVIFIDGKIIKGHFSLKR